MTNTPCLRCLTAGRRTPVTLTGDVYRCPACGFAAQVQRVKVSDIFWGLVDATPGRVWWATGADGKAQAHCLDLVSPGPSGP